MADGRDLLLEIGTEELPSSELHALGIGLRDGLVGALDARGLARGTAEWFATPRRLAVRVAAVAEAEPGQTVEHRGPPVKAAFDATGVPTAAAEGFARRHGVTVDDLERRDGGKAEYLFYTEHRTGRATRELLPELVDEAARAVPAKKRMRWGVPGVTFPRPVHWTVLLYGDEPLDAEVLGMRTGAATRGHRFHHPGAIAIARPADYAERLYDEGRVIADFDRRSALIREQVERAAVEAGGTADVDPELLQEVTSLVEWPVALAGRFDERFLEVPAEALVAEMKDHQRYFPVRDAEGRLLPAFITVSNIASRDPEIVRRGNERVIAPRLADAEFFWHQDRRQPLESRLEGLKAMVFQRQLGTLHDRTRRIAALAGTLAERLGADRPASETAARLAKCDLLTEMVGEFPELQGIMGGYYAEAEGHGPAVAAAIADQYRPAFAGDTLPRTAEGRVLALADRLDVLVGIFAIGRAPSGDKDPFALRRAALGALRILVEGDLELDLETALQDAAAGYGAELEAGAAVPAVFDFMMDRFKAYYTGAGHTPDRFEAVLARRPTRPLDFDARMRAVRDFGQRPEAAALAAANKRIGNILRKSGEDVAAAPEPALFADDAERDLAGAVAGLGEAVGPLVEARDYDAALARLAGLAEPLDRFFDEVMVMTDDAALRANRIALLAQARGLFLRVADLSRIQTAP